MITSGKVGGGSMAGLLHKMLMVQFEYVSISAPNTHQCCRSVSMETSQFNQNNWISKYTKGLKT